MINMNIRKWLFELPDCDMCGEPRNKTNKGLCGICKTCLELGWKHNPDYLEEDIKNLIEARDKKWIIAKEFKKKRNILLKKQNIIKSNYKYNIEREVERIK